MDIQKKLQRVTPEILSEFLYKRSVRVFGCLLCGSEDCRVPQTAIINPDLSSGAVFVDATMVDANGQSQAIMNYHYRLICGNCGYTHFISALPVNEWLDEKGRPEGEVH